MGSNVGTAGTGSTGGGGGGGGFGGIPDIGGRAGGNGGSGTVRLRYLGPAKHGTNLTQLVSNDGTYTYITFLTSTTWTA
jgi:hypothetical protein